MSLRMSLMWISMCSKPEILFACKYLARYGQSFEISHYRCLIRVARYACDAKHQGLVIKGWPINTGTIHLELYVDSDFGADPDTRKST